MVKHGEAAMEAKIYALIDTLEQETPGVKSAFRHLSAISAFGAEGVPVDFLRQAGCLEGAEKLIECHLARRGKDSADQEIIALEIRNLRGLAETEH